MTLLSRATAQENLACVSLFHEADLLPSGYLRIETVFRYPDGTSIEIFVAPTDLLPTIRLTDLGQTSAWLLNLQLKPWLSRKRRGFIEDALHTYGVKQSGGELILEIDGMAHLADGVIRLSQACLRVADLSFTRRSSLQSTFEEEVEDVLNDAELPYDSNPEVIGKYGNKISLNFAVQGSHTKSLVLTLGSQSPSAAHTLANEVFRKWHDLDQPGRLEQRVTLFDDRADVYREEDLERLKGASSVLPFSDRRSVGVVLAA
jgi:hypothetical protein